MFLPCNCLRRQVNKYVSLFLLILNNSKLQIHFQTEHIPELQMQSDIFQIDAAFEEISANPIFGRGYGYRDYWIYMHNDLHPELLGFESVLLLYLVERGWIGLIFFFFMAYFIYKLSKKETISTITILLVFVGYLTSIIMTGVRPLTLLFVCLAYSVTCGIAPYKENDSDTLVESCKSVSNTSTSQ